MSKTVLLLALLLSVAVAKIANIDDIKSKFQKIHTKEKSYNKKVKEIDDISTEGAEATYYYNKGKLKLIKVDILGEMGREEQEYYFDNGKVFFIYTKEISYNAPMYVKAFSKKLSKTKTKRLYFINGHLAKLLVNGKEIAKNSASFRNEEKKSLHLVKKLLYIAKR